LQLVNADTQLSDQRRGALRATFQVTRVPPPVSGERHEVSQEASRDQQSGNDIAQIVQLLTDLKNLRLAAIDPARTRHDRHAASKCSRTSNLIRAHKELRRRNLDRVSAFMRASGRAILDLDVVTPQTQVAEKKWIARGIHFGRSGTKTVQAQTQKNRPS
jgi:hypothetical protein